MPKQEIWLVRHGETEWSRTGQHTGRIDMPLTQLGERQALALRAELAGHDFARVLVSPLLRARRTCELAGYGPVAISTADLVEWNYGRCEGLTTAEIQRERPGWSIWGDGPDGGPDGGETVEEVGVRAQNVLTTLSGTEGSMALFAHGHILRILTATWLGLPPNAGRLFALSTGSISLLGDEHGTRVIRSWNQIPLPASG